MRERVDTILSKVLIFLMGLMVINVLWQVASRYLVRNPSVFTDELAGYLLIWVGLLGAAYATGKGLHLAIDLVPRKLQGRRKLMLETVINALTLIFATLVMLIGGSRLVYLTLLLEQKSSALSIPLGYVYFVVPLSGALICYYTTHNILFPGKNQKENLDGSH